jgi:hypothetical protein
VYPLDREQVLQGCRERSTVAIFGAVMDTYAQSREATAWACKSMQYSELVDDIERYFDGSLYLYLYRDCRDVALSFSRAVVGEKHPYSVSKKWARLQRSAAKVQERVGPERFFPICYEELIQAPEPLLRSLCAFLDVEFQPQMMDFHRSSEARSTSNKSQLWQNVGRPLMADNARKFLTGLTEEEIRICESVAGPELDLLGYERVYVTPGNAQVFGVEQVAFFEAENDRMKDECRSKMDTEDAARRAEQISVMTDRVQYLEELSSPLLIELLGYLEEQHLEKGDHFIQAGRLEKDLFFIVDGAVEVLDGDEVVVTLTRGACVGEVGMLGDLPRTRTLRTAATTRLLRLSQIGLQQMMSDSPELAARLLWMISGSLAERFATVSA